MFHLVRRAEMGEEEAGQEIQAIPDARMDRFVKRAGDIAVLAEESLTEAICGRDNPTWRRSVLLNLKDLKRDLGGPSALERLLADRAAICWLGTNYLETLCARNIENPKVSEYYQRLLDRANRRYLLCLRTIAQVKRLITPVVQMNGPLITNQRE